MYSIITYKGNFKTKLDGLCQQNGGEKNPCEQAVI